MKKVHTWLRFGIQVLYFLLFPSAFAAAFSGITYICSQISTGSRIELTTFVMVLLVLFVYTIVFGRFFCGFACAFGALGDWVHAIYVWICRKLKKKPLKLPEKLASKLVWVKYGVLAVLILLTLTGFSSILQGCSPWTVFSMLIAGNFSLGGYAVGILLLIAILAGMCLQERFFCRFLCPMGAVFSLLPVLPFFSLRRNRENCARGCRACTGVCPSGIELSAKGSWKNASDCFQCQKCADTCPRGNVGTQFSRLKGNEVLFTIIRAVILVILFFWVGI